ncbi:helix-turn-helix domain-containing protein [Desulfobulbus elongatus]|uniref:helix-turn-helix domain-containing protein n=1 Tax=Desulfobulbus elongatus TaxID=53332 RepID=UPI001B8027D0|nr:helix-turn-helix transcriptional regulator [Desulfobulbus elongatus]
MDIRQDARRVSARDGANQCVGCRGEFEIAVSHENFRKDFKVELDIRNPMGVISCDKSGIMKSVASTSEDSARRNPLDEQYSMARLVRELRELTGLTQEKFAAKLGVTFPTINRWENNRAKPSPLALEKIENLLRSLGDKGEALHKAYFGKEA